MESKLRINKESVFQDRRVEAGGGGRPYQHLIVEEHPYLMSAIGDVNAKRILTMGCATGGVTPFARNGAWVVGVDISNKALRQLQTTIINEDLCSHASVCLMNCEQLAFKKDSFDIILFIGVLHHLDISKTIPECYSVLKRGGKIFMSEPLGLHPIINLYRIMTPQMRTAFEHPLKPKDFKVIKQYFWIEEIKGFCLTSIFALAGLYLFRSTKIYEILRKTLVRFDDFLFRWIPSLKYCAWSAVIKLAKRVDISDI